MILTTQVGEKPEVSAYQPTEKERDRIREIMADFFVAYDSRNKPYEEFDDLSLPDRISKDRRNFNQYLTDKPSESWQSDAFRPITRNKIMTIAAFFAGFVIRPTVMAFNDEMESQQEAAELMADIMDWVNETANYDETFLNTIITAMVDPLVFVHTQYAEFKRTVKDGKTLKETLDELYSGIKDAIVPCEDMYLANIFEPDIQKQPYIIRRRLIDYSSARLLYGKKDNFQFVTPGFQNILSQDTGLFYRAFDENLTARLCEEVTYYNRLADLKISLLNGVLMDDPEAANPRKDKNYPFATLRYQKIRDRFAYGKSLAFIMEKDQDAANDLYRMVIDGTKLQTMPPAVVFGDEEINTSIIAPGAVTTIASANPNASFQTINTNNNLNAALTTLDKIESSATESSVDNLQSGTNVSSSDRTKFEVQKVDENAKANMSLFGRQISSFVKQLGSLRLSDICQFLTVGNLKDAGFSYQAFVIPERMVDGRSVSKHIQFTDNGAMSEDEQLLKSLER